MLVVFALLSAETKISTIIAHRTESKEVNFIMGVNDGIVTRGKTREVIQS